MRANIQLKRLRLHPIFFGFADNENLEFVVSNAKPGREARDEEIKKRLEEYQNRFCEAMDDDLNTWTLMMSFSVTLHMGISTSTSAKVQPKE